MHWTRPATAIRVWRGYRNAGAITPPLITGTTVATTDGDRSAAHQTAPRQAAAAKVAAVIGCEPVEPLEEDARHKAATAQRQRAPVGNIGNQGMLLARGPGAGRGVRPHRNQPSPPRTLPQPGDDST